MVSLALRQPDVLCRGADRGSPARPSRQNPKAGAFGISPNPPISLGGLRMLSVSGFRRMWRFVDGPDQRRLRRALIGSAVLACLDTLGVTLILPLTLLLFGQGEDTRVATTLNHMFGVESQSMLAAIVAAAVVTIFVSRGLLGIALLRRTARVALSAEALLAKRLLLAYLHAPLEYHMNHNRSEMQRMLDDSLRRIFRDALTLGVLAAGDILVIVLVTAVVLFVAPVEAAAGGLVLGLAVLIYHRASQARARASSSEMIVHQEDSIRHIHESLGAVKEIQLGGLYSEFSNDLLRVRQDMAIQQTRIMILEALPRYLLEFGMLASAAVVGAVAFARLPADQAVAILALFVGAVFRILGCLNRVLGASTRLIVASPNADSVEHTLAELETGESTASDTNPLLPGSRFQEAKLRDVSYRYPGSEATTLKHISMEVHRGEYVGITGESGAGKTTLLNLLLGLIDPVDGTILIDDRPLTSRRRSWQQRVGYVPQEVAFIDGTIQDNIVLGRSDTVDQTDVLLALRHAQLLSFVDGLRDGVSTRIGESGVRLSGGQRQRLGLARALYGTPEVLVLDEATSALDADTERRLLDVLDDLRGSLTIVVVAHRPSTVARCDRVVHLERGVLTSTVPGAELSP